MVRVDIFDISLSHLQCILCFVKGALNLTHEEFHTVVAPTAITDVSCVGTENKLTECSYSTSPTCDLLNDAGVICQGIAAECSAYFLDVYPLLHICKDKSYATFL